MSKSNVEHADIPEEFGDVSGHTLKNEKNALTVIDISSESGDDLDEQVASNGVRVSNDHDVQSAWETESFYEDIIDELEDYEYAGGPDECSPEEAEKLRLRLHEIGADKFVLETVTTGLISARKLCTAFGIRPFIFDGQPDEACYQLLGLLIARELSKRQPLPQYKTIDDAARLLKTCKNIIVITGAGISTNLGIPDFRSKHTGFYSKLVELGYSEPEEIFNIHNFDEDPTTFYSLAGSILPDLEKWSPTHQFLRLLQDKGKLLTNYSQNIDNLESHAGIKPERLIQCHGSWATATCRKCGHRTPGRDIFANVRKQEIARCENCVQNLKSHKPGLMKRKRSKSSNGSLKKRRNKTYGDSSSDEDYDIPVPGVMKPDITFFGEQLPQTFFERIQNQDVDLVDLVIVIGTSMKVAPVSEVPRIVPPSVPQILISRDRIRHINFDVNLLGDCDMVVTELCRRAGWDLEHEMIKKDKEIQVNMCDEEERHYQLRYKGSNPV